MANTDQKWLIWSFEHDAWWGKNHRGYVTNIKKAGRYDYVEALEIVEGANRYCKKDPKEAILPDFIKD